MPEFPDFEPKYLEDAESVRDRLDADADTDVDKRVGSFFYIATDPDTREFSRLWDMLNDVIAIRSYLYATGVYLDYIASGYGITRKAATKASGEITIVGTDGTIIPSGTRFTSTALTEEDVPVRVLSTTSATIGETTPGEVTVAVEADIVGLEGNVAALAIDLIEDSIDGVASVSNAASLSGGTDQEDDEDLRIRIGLVISTPQGIGNIASYMRWATSIDGVGTNVTVIPIWAGVNTVKVIILDTENSPASQLVMDELQEYLTGPPVLADPTTAPTTALGIAGIHTGTFDYKVTFSDGTGTQKTETKGGPASTPIAATADKIELTAIPLGPTGTLSRDIYRRVGSGLYMWVDEIPDNTTTVYSDNIAASATRELPKTNNTTAFDGVAPIGALVSVSTPSLVSIDVVATVEFDSGYSLDGTAGTIACRDLIEASIQSYVNSLSPGIDVVYNHVKAAFFSIPGVYDVSAMTINTVSTNITIADTEVADTGDLSGITE